jgi:hypothetical protein
LKNTRFSFRRQLVVLALLIAIVYTPTVWYGRVLDDIVVLDKCEKLSWGTLLTEGFRFQRTELGNAWWIEQETIMCYFRPLLLATVRLPMLLAGSADSIQHAINLGLHVIVAGLLLALSRSLLKSPRSAFLATLFFALSFHPRWTMLLITARKEPLVGVFVLLALHLHIRGRWKWAAFAFAGALFSGEHAVAFPLIAFVWDVLVPRSRTNSCVPAPAGRHAWPIWVGYLGILAVYAGVRAFALSGVPLPAPPYFSNPFTPEFLPYTLLKPLVLLFSLTTTVPYVDRPIIELWFNHPAGFAVSALTPVLVITLLLTSAGDRRLCIALLVLSVIAYLPFFPMAAIPFYLYMPSIFYALAVGAALDGASLGPQRSHYLHRRFLIGLVSAAVVVNFLVGIVLSWGPSRPPFNPGVDSPQRVAKAVAQLLENEPIDRKVIFVDAPRPPPFFYFVYQLSSSTGRDPADLAVVTCRHRRTVGEEAKVTFPDPSHVLVESPERPYFANTVKKLLWFFPDGLIAEGRSFERSWFTVEISAVSAPPRGRRQHFFSKEPGISALSIRVHPGADPLVIGFRDYEPVILCDPAATTGGRAFSGAR